MRVKVGDEIRTVERLNFEYNGCIDIMARLENQGGVPQEALEKWFKRAQEAYAALEREKDRVQRRFAPEQMRGAEYSYLFDFDSDEIEYTAGA